MCDRFYSISRDTLCRIAYEVVKKNSMNVPMEWKPKLNSGKLGNDWVNGFVRRHPQLSWRKPQAVSIARAKGFNETEVNVFYQNLKKLIDQHGFAGHQIFNMDETGITIVPKLQSKVLAKKGSRTVAKIVSAERGKLVTSLCCFNAHGYYIPPMFIFPRRKPNQSLINGAPDGSIIGYTRNGWSSPECFLEWLEHFSKYAQPSRKNKILLILDNHSSHISLEAIDYCIKNNIHLLTIPPHTSHKMQPLDVGFFAPLKKAFYKSCIEWTDSNRGQRLAETTLCSIFKIAYLKSADVKLAENSFRSTGIWPFNSSTFSDTDFQPSRIFMNPTEPKQISPIPAPSHPAMNNNEIPVSDSILSPELLANETDNEIVVHYCSPFSSQDLQQAEFEVSEEALVDLNNLPAPEIENRDKHPQNQNFVSAFDLYPIPVTSEMKNTKGPKPGSSVVATSSKYQLLCVEKEIRKLSKQLKAEQNKSKLIKMTPRKRKTPQPKSCGGSTSKKLKKL